MFGNLIAGGANCLPVLIPIFLLNYVGRKKFMLVGMFTCCLGLLGLLVFNAFEF